MEVYMGFAAGVLAGYAIGTYVVTWYVNKKHGINLLKDEPKNMHTK